MQASQFTVAFSFLGRVAAAVIALIALEFLERSR